MSFKFNLESQHHSPSITDPAHHPSIANLIGHGAIYKLMDPDYVKKRLAGMTLKEGLTADDVVSAARALFFRMVDEKPYKIHGGLLSYLTFPGKGKLITPIDPKTGEDINKDSKNVPAFMTFAGQFIDHDLTQNLINLLDPQCGKDITDGASPLIDLDNVYTRSNSLSNGKPDDIFDENMKFRLVPVHDSKGKILGYDHARDNNSMAYMHDIRNDENQMVSQIHIFVERIHNKLMDINIAATQKKKGSALFASEIQAIFDEVRVEVIRNWQSFVWNQYLPTVVNEKSLSWVTSRLDGKNKRSELDQKPVGGVLNLPHEFAISFRMGHSMLRDRYRVQKSSALEIRLFEAHDPTHQTDLTGSKHLAAAHVIDWHYFGDAKTSPFSNGIDTQVTNKVFDLPESTIPDNDKMVGNLAARNLIRSSQVDLSHAEFIYDSLHGMPELGPKLTPQQVEPDAQSQRLFRVDNDGNYDPCNPFRTPLWYYVLKEAEVIGKGKLGPLGGRIVAGVIAAGIYFSDNSFIEAAKQKGACAWKSQITKKVEVNFQDLVEFVLA